MSGKRICVCTRKPKMPQVQKDALTGSSMWCSFLGVDYLDGEWMSQVLKQDFSTFHKKPQVNSSDYSSDNFLASAIVTSQKTDFSLVKSHVAYFRRIY